METLNKYGNISGGVIFDTLDIEAHKIAIKEIGECVTANASIHFYNPLIGGVQSGKIQSVTANISERKCELFVLLKYEDIIIATGTFLFIKI